MQTEAGAHPTPERLMQFAFGFGPPLIIEAALKHGVFDTLAACPQTLEQVHTATGASERGLRAIMDTLVGLGLLAKDGERRYSLTPESAVFLVSSSPGYHGGLFLHTSTQLMPAWMNMTEIVQTGKPSQAVNQESEGAPFFEAFVEAIFPLSYPAAQKLAESLNIAEAEQPVLVLDLAAGSGVWGIALAQKSPKVQVTAVDWESVLPVTHRIANRFGLEERFRFVGGDLLEVDFGRGHHVATLGQILHSEGEERSRMLLKKTYDALAPGGTIAVAEFLVNEERTGPVHGLMFSVNMLVNTHQGATFSFGEIAGWLREAGFENARTLEVPGPSPLVLATKPGK